MQRRNTMSAFDVHPFVTKTEGPVLVRHRPDGELAFLKQQPDMRKPERKYLGAAQGGRCKSDSYRLLLVVLCIGSWILAGCQSRGLQVVSAQAALGTVEVVGTLTLMVGVDIS